MTRIHLARLWMTALLIGVLCIAAEAQPPEGTVEGEAILRFAPEAVPDSVLSGTGASLSDSIANRNVYLVSFSPSIPVDTMVRRLQARQGVMKAQPNFHHELPEVLQMSQSFPDQNAPVYLKGVSPEPYYAQPSPVSIGLDSAQLLSSGEEMVVAVIDNGINLSHPLFEGYIASGGYDFVNSDGDPAEEPGEMYGHGTFVSGIVRLVAPEAHVLPLRAFDGDGVATTYDICEAIYWAVAMNVDVINMSFGLYFEYPVISDAMDDAFQADIIMVAAAGNDGLAVVAYPAGHDGVISVASLDTLEQLADFSNYGINLDICAPGVNVYSSLAGDYEWGTWSGTSFSAPMASGVCALILSRDPDAAASELHCHLRNSARAEFLWGSITPPDSIYGYGCLDAYHATLAYAFGDMDISGRLNLSDITSLIAFVYMDGPRAAITDRLGDFNCDGKMNLADITGLIGYVYLGGTDHWPCYDY